LRSKIYIDEGYELIVGQEGDTIKIASFIKEDVIYCIEIDVANNRIKSCTCEDHKNSAWICKHMFLVCVH
jgi:hypothetical protein